MDDRATIGELKSRLAAAEVENAALRKSEERNGLLMRFSDAVRGLSDPALVAQASCRLLTEQLGTERALWAIIDWEKREYVAEWVFGADGVRVESARWPLDAQEPFAAEHLAGRPVVYHDSADDPRFPGALRAVMAGRGLRAGIAVPVLVAGTLRAVLSTSQGLAARWWRPEEIAFVEALAGRAWAAIGLARADTALRQGKAWLAGQNAAFRAAMNGEPLEVALGILIRTAIEQAESERRCAFYIADGASGTLRHVVGMPEAYARHVNGFVISAESLSCGLAAALREPILTVDVEREPRWAPWLWMARTFGFRGCWSFPIETAAGTLVGSLAMYFREPREATPHDRELAATITQAAAIIISRYQENEERARTERALHESEERLRQFGEASLDVLWIRDAGTLQWIYLTPAFEQIYGLERGTALRGDNMTGWLDLILPEDRERVLDAIQRVRGGDRATYDFRIRRPSDGTVRWLRNNAFPMCDPAGRICWLGGVGQDITGEKEAVARQELLVNELQHRARNLLGVVTAIANQTVARGGSISAFEERLQALSRVQGLLSQSGSDSVEVGALVRAELAAYANGASKGVVIAGPEVRLTARQMQNFALALHELTTNAVKHGALRGGGGRLMITWEVILDRRERRRLALSWVESGMVLKPETVLRRGYGTELIQEALAYALQARVDYKLEQEGVRCRIEMPVS
jgi:PAS domain S-box-containing protein